MNNQLLVATNNIGKLTELRSLLGGFDVELLSLDDVGGLTEVEETGTTFAENAQLKASGYATQTGLPAIADDSGLEVNALGGRPGVYSARYGGDEMNFVDKMSLLLNEITSSGSPDRTARFVSAIAFADATGKILHIVEGVCNGQIAQKPVGEGGFGYDPLFIPDGFDRTFGELSSKIKHKISHRALAFSQIIPFLRGFYEY